MNLISSNMNITLAIIFGEPLQEYFAFFASVATVVGIISLWWAYRKRSVSAKWRENVVLDLIRHFFINNSISDTILIKGQKPWPGVISRFATLQTDTELAKFSYDEKYYSRIHRLCLFIRNYNSVVEFTEANLSHDDYPIDELKTDLADLSARSLIITDELIDLCNALSSKSLLSFFGFHKKISEESLKDYRNNQGKAHTSLITYSKLRAFLLSEYSDSKVDGWKKKGYYDSEVKIADFEKDSPGDFYGKTLSLRGRYEDLIRYNYTRLRFRK